MLKKLLVGLAAGLGTFASAQLPPISFPPPEMPTFCFEGKECCPVTVEREDGTTFQDCLLCLWECGKPCPDVCK